MSYSGDSNLDMTLLKCMNRVGYILYIDGEGVVLLENVRLSEGHSILSQCVDFTFIGDLDCCEHTAGVICMDESLATKQVPIVTGYVSTTKCHMTIPTSHMTQHPQPQAVL